MNDRFFGMFKVAFTLVLASLLVGCVVWIDKYGEFECNKITKITNKKQFEALVQILQQNPHAAKGQRFAENCKVTSGGFADIWEEITKKLNSSGPPVRNVLGWQKVWSDLKLKTKKKLAHNKKEMNATGGGPNKLKYISNIEEGVISLLSLDKTVNCPGRICGVDLPNSTSHKEIEESSKENLEENISDIRAEQGTQPTTSKRKKTTNTNKNNYRERLLEKQTKETTYLNSQIKEIKYNLRKIVKLKEEKLKILKEKEERETMEAELKIQILHLKQRKLELEVTEKEESMNNNCDISM